VYRTIDAVSRLYFLGLTSIPDVRNSDTRTAEAGTQAGTHGSIWSARKTSRKIFPILDLVSLSSFSSHGAIFNQPGFEGV
jgi:hypothetical protein